jgi:hypothetical protein
MESASAVAREAGQQQPARPASLYIIIQQRLLSGEGANSLVQIEALLLLYAVGANNISSRRLDPSFFRNVQAGC